MTQRTRRILIICLYWALLLSSSSTTWAAAPEPVELLQKSRAAYDHLTAYRDLGEIEWTAGGPFGETSTHFFETAANQNGFVWRFLNEEGHERVVWTEKDVDHSTDYRVYDGKRRQEKVVDSLPVELVPLGSRALRIRSTVAYSVPLLLSGLAETLPQPADATVEGEEPCGSDSTCWVLSFHIPLDHVAATLWIDQQNFLIREAQVTLYKAETPDDIESATKILVRHSIESINQALATEQVRFRPPVATQTVDGWDETPEIITARRIANQWSGSDSPPVGFVDEITVAYFPLTARIVDRKGNPILDLKPDDLVIRVGKTEIPIASLDWHSSVPSKTVGDQLLAKEEHQSDSTSTAIAAGTESSHSLARLSSLPSTPQENSPSLRLLNKEPNGQTVPGNGRLVVIFVQIGGHMVVTLEESYIAGHLKLLPHLKRLLQDFQPTDRVALVSFDSKLKLWQDFTADHNRVADTIYESIGFAKPPANLELPAESQPSIARHLDYEAAKNAANTEKALQVLGRALAPLPGPKDIIFVGWGLGRLVQGFGVITPNSYRDAVSILGKAKTALSVLDVSQAPGHALAAGLKTMAHSTGGTYASTYDFASRKVDQLARTLRGYYVITVDRQDLEHARGPMEVQLRNRSGTVLTKPYIF